MDDPKEIGWITITSSDVSDNSGWRPSDKCFCSNLFQKNCGCFDRKNLCLAVNLGFCWSEAFAR